VSGDGFQASTWLDVANWLTEVDNPRDYRYWTDTDLIVGLGSQQADGLQAAGIGTISCFDPINALHTDVPPWIDAVTSLFLTIGVGIPSVNKASVLKSGQTLADIQSVLSGQGPKAGCPHNQGRSDLVVTTTSIPNATQLIAYSAALAADGEPGPYQWSISSGGLPLGLNLSADGRIAGTPALHPDVPGVHTFTVRAVNGSGFAAERTFTMEVTTALRFPTTSLPNYPAGSRYDQQLAAYGGVPPYSWKVISGSLPPAFKLNASTGIIGGQTTSSRGQTARFTVEVKDSVGTVVRQALSIKTT
jgi:hypothetical protein